ncbi:hypothetical protein HK101_005965 [Irineochytrium annulatum]|nr:hypothetical protein HK101_005965 [Irineochytrium annulatum]
MPAGYFSMTPPPSNRSSDSCSSATSLAADPAAPRAPLPKADMKRAKDASLKLVAASVKARTALHGTAAAFAEMADSFEILAAAKAFDPERVNGLSCAKKGHGYASTHVEPLISSCKCHAAISKTFKDLADRMLNEFEKPLQRSIEHHSNHLTNNYWQAMERSIMKRNKEVHDRIKRAEGEVRRQRSKDPTLLFEAVQQLAVHTCELGDLRVTYHKDLLDDEDLRAAEMFGFCSALSIAQESAGSLIAAAAREAHSMALMVDEPIRKASEVSTESFGSEIASAEALLAMPAQAETAAAISMRRAGSYDSLTSRKRSRNTATSARKSTTAGDIQPFRREGSPTVLFHKHSFDYYRGEDTPTVEPKPTTSRLREAASHLAAALKAKRVGDPYTSGFVGRRSSGLPVKDLDISGRGTQVALAAEGGDRDLSHLKNATDRDGAEQMDLPEILVTPSTPTTSPVEFSNLLLKSASPSAPSSSATPESIVSVTARPSSPPPIVIPVTVASAPSALPPSSSPPTGNLARLWNFRSIGASRSSESVSSTSPSSSTFSSSSPSPTKTSQLTQPMKSLLKSNSTPVLAASPLSYHLNLMRRGLGGRSDSLGSTSSVGSTNQEQGEHLAAPVKKRVRFTDPNRKMVELRRFVTYGGEREDEDGATGNGAAGGEHAALDCIGEEDDDSISGGHANGATVGTPESDYDGDSLDGEVTVTWRRGDPLIGGMSPLIGLPASRHAEDDAVLSVLAPNNPQNHEGAASPPTDVIEGRGSWDNKAAVEKENAVRHGVVVSTLEGFYPGLFTTGAPAIRNVEVRRVVVEEIVEEVGGGDLRTPAVYFPPQSDVASEVGSVVEDGGGGGNSGDEPGGDTWVVETEGLPPDAELVMSLYDFTARSAKELNLEKNDVIWVHKRHQTWIYGTKLKKKLRSEVISTSSSSSTSEEKLSDEGISPKPGGGLMDRLRNSSSESIKSALANANGVNGALPKRRSEVSKKGGVKQALPKGDAGWLPQAFVVKYSLA